MPLSRQLSLSLLLILLLTFAGTMWVNISNSKDYIEQQLGSHAQDTATSLGLSIAPYMGDGGNLSMVDTMLNVIFDRGYYQSIVLTDMQNKLLLEKRNPYSLEQVPKWFVDLFPLTPPASQTEISTGWNLVGKLAIRSHPGLAYKQLWQNAVQSFWLITAIFITALLLIWLLVKVITTPILAVVRQAQAISEQIFEPIQSIPRTPELRTVVEALNKMADKLADIFQSLTKQTQEYRNIAYRDGLTNLSNRRVFELTFSRWLADPEHHSTGYLVIVRLSSLEHVNRQIGYADGDLYVKTVGRLLIDCSLIENAQHHVFRLNGADFGLLLDAIDETECIEILEYLVQALTAVEKSEYQFGIAHMGVSAFIVGDSSAHVLEQADNALTQAVGSHKKWQLARLLPVQQSHNQWREQLQIIVGEKRATFAAQAIQSMSGDILYHEWFARFNLADGQSFLPMAQVIPASIRLDFAIQLDELLVNKTFEKLPLEVGLIGLNLSRLSLCQQSFQQWLLAELVKNSAICAKLVLEIPERALVTESEHLAPFVQSLIKMGVKITVEHFGAQLASVTHLRKIKPHFLKIDGRFTRNIESEPDNQLFVRSLVNIAHGLNIQVIAEMVETEQEANCLRELNVDHLQGYYIAVPKEPPIS